MRTLGRRRLLIAAAAGLAVAVITTYALLGSFSGNSDASALGSHQEACPVTVPTGPFLPPAPFSAEPTGMGDRDFWYGTTDLFTALPASGLRLVTGGDKTFWWSLDFDYHDEPWPAIVVTAEPRRSSAAAVRSLVPATHGWVAGGQAFMLAGIDIPEAGCWDLRADYRGHVLELVVEVRRPSAQ